MRRRMSDEQQRPTPEELLQTKDRVLEQWRLLPAEHQATMLLVLLKEIGSADMRDWVRNAVIAFYPLAEQLHPQVSISLVSREKLAELDIAEQDLATLTDDDLATIATRIEVAFRHEEFWQELMLQALEFHTEQVIREKRL